MEPKEIYDSIRQRARELADQAGLLDCPVELLARVLSPEEAIGQPGRSDFPLQRGKEKLMEAYLLGARGQAFTDQPGNYRGLLGEVLEISPTNNYERAVLVATVNALMRYIGRAEHTIHCRDEGPQQCAKALIGYLEKRFGRPRIGVVGLQPALVEACARLFPVRVLDLDPDNIGKMKFGVLIEDGSGDIASFRQWAEVLLVTGSTLTNGTIAAWLNASCPTLFYGTTVAGAAVLLGLERFCPASS
ncbi:Rossmann-like domain-containing protein [Desulfothermobacter acidiphilus]|uniref:Rossmann-like domain-containing protein n=1 Tax=Desulfothermobacter acidiphilus TaxID=1938353 RepID=UPI003F8A80BD